MFGGALLLTLLNIGGAAVTDSSDTSIDRVDPGRNGGRIEHAYVRREYRADRDCAAGISGAGVREPGSRLLDGWSG
jgi:hypothetical protein